MATSPVRIRDEDKLQLERLRQDLIAATGEKPTQQDVVGEALAFAARHKDRFLAEAAWRPLKRPEIRRWHDAIARLGGWEAVPVEAIDDVVYGEP